MNNTKSIKLSDIPDILLPVINSKGKGKAWVNGNAVDEIFIFRNMQYRINTNRGQFRYSLDSEQVIDIEM